MKFFGNLPVRGKIFGTFAIALVIALAIGIIGIVSNSRLETEMSSMYYDDIEPIGSISHIIQNVMTLSSSFDMAILAAMGDDYDGVNEFEDSVNSLYVETDTLLNDTKSKIHNDEAQTLFDSAYEKYYGTLVPTGPAMFAKLHDGKIDEAETIMGAADVAIGAMTEEFQSCLNVKIEKAYVTYQSNSVSSRNISILQTVILVIGFVLVCALAILLSVLITRPMHSLMKFANETAKTGNLELSTREIDRIAERHDEIGKTVRAICEMTAIFRAQAQILKTVSHGDFTPEVGIKSHADTVGNSLSNMLDEMGDMLRDVSAASRQVATGVSQISVGSNELANSINEQTNSIESISAALQSIGEKITLSLSSAETARELANKINREAKAGDEKMSEMVTSVHNINEAASGIGRIIKVIEDIAFQTNILALNAAVEAARAGQHGKGFSVVAEEVRNLAAKSAAAASETNALISNSIMMTRSGVEIAEVTKKLINDITTDIQEISVFIDRMSKSAEDEVYAMNKLHIGVNEISEVIQKTSANAEQSNAACEEINALSATLDELVSRFKIRD